MIRVKFIFTAFFLVSFFSIAQKTSEIDAKARSFASKAWGFYEIQSDSCLFYANKGIEYSRKNNSTLGEILNLEIKGIYFEEVKNNFEKASELYFKAIEIAEKKYPKSISSLYNNLCIMYMTTNPEKSYFYGKKAVENAKVIRGERDEAKAYVNYGIAQSLLKKYEEANKTLNYFLTLDVISQYEKNLAYLRIAKNYREQGKFDKAQPLLLKIVTLDSLKGQREYVQDYSYLIENSLQIKDRKAVNKYFPMLLKSYTKEKNLSARKGALETISKVYKYYNEPNKALEYQTILLEVNDSINSRLFKKNILELETQYQTKKKEEQIIEEQNKKELWTYISILAFIILIAVAILLFKNGQKRKQLRANKIELEKLLNQRNMLLRETHHRVKNSFQMVSSLLQLQAQGSEAEVAVTALDSAVERVNSMIVLHQQLYAKDNLLGVDLQVYIKDLVSEINTSYASENINFDTTISSIIVDIDTATSLGLLVNELATNSIKYAWKNDETEKVITINLEERENEIHFTMFDNGVIKKTKTTQQNYGSELIEILVERLDANKIDNNTNNDFGLSIAFKKSS